MIALICVIAVVALISLYDHFTGRSWQQVTSEERNEAVFEKRNRAYGAYAIRRDYDKRLMLIVAGLVGGIGVIYAATRGGDIVMERKPDRMVVIPIVPFDDKEQEKEEPEIIKDDKPATTSNDQRTDFPEIVAGNENVIIAPPEDGVSAGTPTPIGTGSEFGINPPGPPSTGGGTGTPPTPPPSGPETYVDEAALFPGGVPAMRSFIGNNMVYPQVARDLEIEGKCFLRFVVGTDGDISDVTVTRGVPDCPECDKEAKRVIKIMPRWKPAKKNGKTVDSYFNIPITFTLK
jgi:protein TonB